jgi:hypothetical protein
MKRVLGLAVLMVFAGIAFTANVSAGDKVTICHFDNSSDELGHVKDVNVLSLQDHLDNHGDLINEEGQLPEYWVLEDGKSCEAITYEQ